MRSVAGYTPDSLVEFGAKKLFKCSSYFFTVPKGQFFTLLFYQKFLKLSKLFWIMMGINLILGNREFE
jgi:hypothetical protein